MKFKILLILSLSFLTPITVLAEDEEVILGGDTVSIVADYEGVVVTGMYDFEIDGEWITTINSTNLQIGDKIIAIEDHSIESLNDLYHFLSLSEKSNHTYEVTIIRYGNTLKKELNVYYLEDEKIYKTGLYVKDQVKGIGTVTYYNPENKTYGALGHEMMEQDLGIIAEVSAGELLLASVSHISKSTPSTPGAKSCMNTNIVLGNLQLNTPFGIYGNYVTLPDNAKTVLVASQYEITPGIAHMYTVIHGQSIEMIELRITHIYNQSSPSIKGFKFEIVDQRIIDITGGIVQGMSGSPIIQNGKLIGAVTHMVTNQPTVGYGIFIENMLETGRNMNN